MGGDIYTGVETKVGQFLREHVASGGARGDLQIHTKLVPDIDVLDDFSADSRMCEGVIHRSLNRLGVQCLDLVQFHWWDWAKGDHVKAYAHLASLMERGLVRNIGVTNYDATHLQQLLDAGLPVHCNQVQYSLLDRRVGGAMAQLCVGRGVRLLPYGVLAGGFLSDRWLGKPDPGMDDLPSRSLVKYYLIVEEFGGWAMLQRLLSALRRVATTHSTTIATVAQAWVLSRPAVGGVIVGLSDPSKGHIDASARAFRLAWEIGEAKGEGWEEVNAVLRESAGPHGPFYQLERNKTGPHGSIMRYTCNQMFSPAHVQEFETRLARAKAVFPVISEENGKNMLREAATFPSPERERLGGLVRATLASAMDSKGARAEKRKQLTERHSNELKQLTERQSNARKQSREQRSNERKQTIEQHKIEFREFMDLYYAGFERK